MSPRLGALNHGASPSADVDLKNRHNHKNGTPPRRRHAADAPSTFPLSLVLRRML